MPIQRLDLSGDPAHDGEDVHALHAVQLRAWQHESPRLPQAPVRWARASWAYGQSGEVTQTWVCRDDDRSPVIGGYNLAFPTADNTHVGLLKLVVDPHHRRLGHGRALLDHAVARMRAARRRLLVCETAGVGAAAGPAFAAAVGAEPGLREPIRVLDLRSVDADVHAKLHAETRPAAAGYTLLCWVDHTPEEYVDDAVALMARMSDAPLEDLDMEGEVWDRKRYRAGETGHELRGLRAYTIAARHDTSGSLVGTTTVCASPEQPGWAHQEETVVLPDHRGHRLGLLMKLSMLSWLSEREPRVHRILTGNAGSNHHMIRINDLIGFTVVDHSTEWQLHVP